MIHCQVRPLTPSEEIPHHRESRELHYVLHAVDGHQPVGSLTFSWYGSLVYIHWVEVCVWRRGEAIALLTYRALWNWCLDRQIPAIQGRIAHRAAWIARTRALGPPSWVDATAEEDHSDAQRAAGLMLRLVQHTVEGPPFF